jgi:CheY-specific phosphatase CheX
LSAVVQPLHAKLQLDGFATQLCAQAVRRTFLTMFKVEPQLIGVQRLNESPSTPPLVENEISATMSVAQLETEGILVFRCGSATMAPLVAQLFGEQQQLKNSVDSVGELTNVIFGLMIDGFNQHGLNVQMSLPQVNLGPQSPVGKFYQGLRLSFATANGPLHLELLLLDRQQEAS